MRQLGLPALAGIFASTCISPQKNKHINEEDSESEYNPKENDTSEGDLSDDNIIDEMDTSAKVLVSPYDCFVFVSHALYPVF
jgi:hypothetical protein